MEKTTKVAILGSMHAYVKAYINEHYTLIDIPSVAEIPAGLQAHAEGIHIVICSAYTGLKSEWITLLPNLKLVCNFGVGYDSTDIQALKARGIPFSNTPDVLNDAVADTAMALLLSLVRQVTLSDKFVRDGEWEKRAYPLTPDVAGKKVGVVGLGSIGKVIVKRLSGFDCQIAYHNRSPRDDVDFRYFDTIIELAQWADFLIVATVGGAQTKHLINADVLKALGPESFLINISRGSVIDEAALIQALKEKAIAGAGLDVFENEPMINREFSTLSNTVLMPHVGSGSIEARQAMAALVVDNIKNYRAKGDVITKVV